MLYFSGFLPFLSIFVKEALSPRQFVHSLSIIAPRSPDGYNIFVKKMVLYFNMFRQFGMQPSAESITERKFTMLQGKTVLLGITGGIAAYKSAMLASALKKQHADVHVIMTKNATRFIAPLTLKP